MPMLFPILWAAMFAAPPAAPNEGRCDPKTELSGEAVAATLEHAYRSRDGKAASDALVGQTLCFEHVLPKVSDSAMDDEHARSHGWWAQGGNKPWGITYVSYAWPTNAFQSGNDVSDKRSVRRTQALRVKKGDFGQVLVMREFGTGFGRGQFNYRNWYSEDQGWRAVIRATIVKYPGSQRDYVGGSCLTEQVCQVAVRFTRLSLVSTLQSQTVATWDLRTVSGPDKVRRTKSYY